MLWTAFHRVPPGPRRGCPKSLLPQQNPQNPRQNHLPNPPTPPNRQPLQPRLSVSRHRRTPFAAVAQPAGKTSLFTPEHPHAAIAPYAGDSSTLCYGTANRRRIEPCSNRSTSRTGIVGKSHDHNTQNAKAARNRALPKPMAELPARLANSPRAHSTVNHRAAHQA